MKTLLRFFLDERRVDHSDYDWYGEFCVNEIEDTAIISCKTAREISTTSLGELILDRLYKIDKVAYIRFASAYKHFETLEEFLTEIKNAEDKKHE